MLLKPKLKDDKKLKFSPMGQKPVKKVEGTPVYESEAGEAAAAKKPNKTAKKSAKKGATKINKNKAKAAAQKAAQTLVFKGQ